MKTKDSRFALEAAFQKAAEDLRAANAAYTTAYCVATRLEYNRAYAAYSKAQSALEAYQAKQSAARAANLVKLK